MLPNIQIKWSSSEGALQCLDPVHKCNIQPNIHQVTTPLPDWLDLIPFFLCVIEIHWKGLGRIQGQNTDHQHLAVQWLLRQHCGSCMCRGTYYLCILLVTWCGWLSWIEEQRRKWRFGKFPESGLGIEVIRLLAHIRHGDRQGAGHGRLATFLLMSSHHLRCHCSFLLCLFKGRQGLCVIAFLVFG